MRINYNNIDFGKTEYHQSLEKASVSVDKIRSSIINKDPYYRIFDFALINKQVDAFKKFVDDIQGNYTDIILIGMGGAALNPQSLLGLAKYNLQNEINVHYLDNTDPFYFTNIIKPLNFANSAVIVISNSGNTLETNALTKIIIEYYKDNNIRDIGKQFYFITNENSGKLKDIGNEIKANFIPHQNNISGRFSGLSNVSLFIAAIKKLDIKEYLAGAEATINEFFETKVPLSMQSAAVISYLNHPILVNIGYLQQFRSYLEWYAQIIAESLGKNGKGYTPLSGLGPNDQHSLLQLYLSGPSDKLYNFFYINDLENCVYDKGSINDKFYNNRNLASINNINYQATKLALTGLKKPVREVLLSDTSLETIGRLHCNAMLEVIILAEILSVNPFNQPSVELIKNNAQLLMG